MNTRNLRLLTASLGALIILSSTLRAQVDNWTPSGGDGESWEIAGNWSAGVPISTSDVVIDINPTGPDAATIGVGNDESIATLTFGPSLEAIQITPASNQRMAISGNIMNQSANIQTFNLPVDTPSGPQVDLIYNGNVNSQVGAGLDFANTLTVNLNNIATTNVTVSGALVFTINSNAAGGFGQVGTITAAGATISAGGTYTGAIGDFFPLSTGTLSGATVTSTSDLPTLTTGLTWVTTLIQKGILFVEPSAGGTVINSGVTLPIGSDTEFNPSGSVTTITLNGGTLLTSNYDTSLDTGGGTQGTPFSTTRAITINSSTSSTLAATTGTMATYSGAITDEGSGTPAR